MDCPCEMKVLTNGSMICIECGKQNKYLEPSLLGINDVRTFVQPYKRSHRLKRLYSSVFGFTKVENQDLEIISSKINIIGHPISKTFPLVYALIHEEFPKLKRKICSVYRQIGYRFAVIPRYQPILDAFKVLDGSGIQSFNYLLHYVIYGADRELFNEYHHFIKPQTKRLSKKNDSMFIEFLKQEPRFTHLIPIVGYKKLQKVD